MLCAKTRRSLFITVAVCFTLIGLSQNLLNATAMQADEAALRAVVEKFYAAYGKKYLADLMALWSEKSPDFATTKQTLQQQFANEDYMIGSPSISRIKVEGEKAGLRVTVELTAVNTKSKQQRQERMVRNFGFVKEGGEWKVWRYAPAVNDLAEALAKAESEAERARLLVGEKELVTLELVRALNTRGTHFRNQGDYTKALTTYNLAQNIAEQINDKMGIARTLINVGGLHYLQGNYVQALERLQRGMTISEAIDDKAAIAGSLTNIGSVNAVQGNYFEALESFQKSLAITAAIGDKEVNARALINIGNVHTSQGNYVRALEFYLKGLAIGEVLDNKAIISGTLNNIGGVHERQGSYAQALNYYQKNLTMKEALSDKAGTALALGNIGFVYGLQGSHNQAMEYYQKSLAIREALGDKRGVAATLNNIGGVHKNQGDYERAVGYIQKSLAMREAIGDKPGIVFALASIGDAYREQGRHTQALEFAESASNIARQIGDVDILWRTRSIVGATYRNLNRPAEARRAFEEAISTIEKTRTQVAGGEQEAQRFFANKLSPYLAMVDLLVAENNLAEALTYAERAKSRTLLDVLHSGRVNITKAMTMEEQEQERELKNKLFSLNTQIYREKLRDKPDQARLADLERQLQKPRLDYEAFETSLYAAHPELKVRRGEAQMLTLEEARPLLSDAGTVVLKFVVAEEKSSLFVLTKSASDNQAAVEVKVFPIAIKQKDLEERVTQFRKQVAERDQAFAKNATAMFQLLLAPARPLLQGKTTLIIVPDGPLWELPFQALQSPENRYLLQDHAVFYAPSLTVLREMVKLRRQNRTPATTPTLLAVGNPALGQQTVKLVQGATMGEKLVPLPAAQRQAEELGKLYGQQRSKVYTGADATEERVKAESANYNILHLAAHGILNNRSPMYSHIVLSQMDENGKEDGLLEAWELMKLDLKADLAVLSACETARGRVVGGEGVIGLTWALFVAGCPTTVVSQWKVNDQSTADLMVEFHRRLRTRSASLDSRNSIAQALRQAALKLLGKHQYQHPYFWAGFIVVGDGY